MSEEPESLVLSNPDLLDHILRHLPLREKFALQCVSPLWRERFHYLLSKQTTIGVVFIPSKVNHIDTKIRQLFHEDMEYQCYNCEKRSHLPRECDIMDITVFENPKAWLNIVKSCPKLERLDIRGADLSRNANFVEILSSLQNFECLHMCSTRFTINQWYTLCRIAHKIRHLSIDSCVDVFNPQNGKTYKSYLYFARFLNQANQLEKVAITFHNLDSIIKSLAFKSLHYVKEINIYLWDCNSEISNQVMRRLAKSRARKSITHLEFFSDFKHFVVSFDTIEVLTNNPLQNLKCLSLELFAFSFLSYRVLIPLFSKLVDLTLYLKHINFDELDVSGDIKPNNGVTTLKLVDAKMTPTFCSLIGKLMPKLNFLKLVDSELQSRDDFQEWIASLSHLRHLCFQFIRNKNMPQLLFNSNGELLVEKCVNLKQFTVYGSLSSLSSTKTLLISLISELDFETLISSNNYLKINDNSVRVNIYYSKNVDFDSDIEIQELSLSRNINENFEVYERKNSDKILFINDRKVQLLDYNQQNYSDFAEPSNEPHINNITVANLFQANCVSSYNLFFVKLIQDLVGLSFVIPSTLYDIPLTVTRIFR